jgi:DMSO/TMAO reductase YedYZ molybdopterin-dependent catalytic subunit
MASNTPSITRREALIRGGAAAAALALARAEVIAGVLPKAPGEEVIPFLDQPAEPPAGPGPWPLKEVSLLDWQSISSWITPNEGFFRVGHYNKPVIEEKDWKLDVTGLVDRTGSYRLADVKAMPRKEVTFTLECSGNNGFPWFWGGIGNAKWTGTPLAPILQKAGLKKNAVEIVFYGSDEGDEEVRGQKTQQNFARSMSVEQAMQPDNLLCYEMNGTALAGHHGFPLRLIAPGWFGIANVKWLKRIEVLDTRFMGRFMAKDYVTLREKTDGGRTEWTMTSVGRVLLKSVTAKVTREGAGYKIQGAAWGGPVARVEVRIDESQWQSATVGEGKGEAYAWKFWSLDWKNPAPGEHTITSRAVDADGNIQPAMDDPAIAGKKTYWESNGQLTRRIRIG